MFTRRHFVKQLSALAATRMVAASGAGLLATRAQAGAGVHWRMPDEGDKQVRAFIAVSYTHLTLPTKRIV